MATFDPENSQSASDDTRDPEFGRLLRQQVMADLSRDDGLLPEYRNDIHGPEEFEAALLSMPLIAIWGEHETAEGRAFSISVNPLLVESAIAGIIDPTDPWFNEMLVAIVADLSALTRSSLVTTMSETGLSAREICESL